MKSDKLESVLRNIAWDFTIPRVMETIMTTCGESDFFIPIFLSVNKDLRGLLKLFPIKGCIFNPDGMQIIPIPSKSSIEYFEENSCAEYLENLMNDEINKKRLQVYHNNQNNNYEILEKELNELKASVETSLEKGGIV